MVQRLEETATILLRWRPSLALLARRLHGAPSGCSEEVRRTVRRPVQDHGKNRPIGVQAGTATELEDQQRHIY